ncbi:TonB-dependent receptor [Sphingobacterium sp. SGR-19]|uniref:TonB-dependent receptor n=1 Tax=Sphingobacterium sp. SGR-19 TaxID=2710886 RepID=UPI0013ECCBC3|nr:TonB-dependent receptor plug domain-containing protein [Sphingobacterium sp. SGR-19]NGM64116.1 TonB-dependent receptor plug domain-containing protein [Sphingobacterium sp. SGR-19]
MSAIKNSRANKDMDKKSPWIPPRRVSVKIKLWSKDVPGLIMAVLLSVAGSQIGRAQDVIVLDSVPPTNTGGLEDILQGQVAGLLVKSWTGTAGSQSIINLRGLSLKGTDESTLPLFMVNGVPFIGSPSAVTGINPLSYYSADQIERVEIIKDIDQLAALGIQAPNGAINLIIKEGVSGLLRVLAKVAAGVDYFAGFDAEKDAFYNYNPAARKSVYAAQSLIHEQYISIDGGGDYGSYLFGLNNYNAAGGIENSGYQRQNLFVNAKYKISEPFYIRFYSNLALADREGRYAGQYNRDLSASELADEGFFMDDNKNVGLLSSIDLNYRFTPHLTVRSVAGLSYETAGRDLYIPSNILDGQVLAGSEAFKRQMLSVHTSLNYQHRFSDLLKVNITLGNQLVNSDCRMTSVEGSKGLESGGSDYVKVVNGYNANQTQAYSDSEPEKLLSFYGTFHWDYKEKLFLNMVGRADGSSLYKNKWAFYPALSLTYDMHQDLGVPVRFKTGYGRTGQRSGPERYRGELIGLGDYYGGNKLGITQLYAPFADAKSATIDQFDANVDVAIHKFVQVELTYFNKQYRDFTYMRYLPNTEGLDYAFETGGGIRLHGFELALQARWIQRKALAWSSRFNLAVHRNRVTKLPGEVAQTSLAYLSPVAVGDQVSSIIAYEGNEGRIIGNSQPSTFGGLTNELRMGNVSIGFTLTYGTGADAVLESYQSRYIAERLGAGFPLAAHETPFYFTTELPDGNTEYRGISDIEDVDFVRLNKFGLSYHFTDYLKKWKIKDAALTLSGENLLTFSAYKGLNPEENITGIRKANLGYTGTALPSSVVLGMKLTF